MTFEEALFLRVTFEYQKTIKTDMTDNFNETLESYIPTFQQYQIIFEKISRSLALNSRLVLSEWIKFSLILVIED